MGNANNIHLALFGESDHGKSHYGAQLLARIEKETCQLKMRETPKDLSAFEGVRTRLNEGLPASHTASSVYQESVWPVVGENGLSLDLIWPDYGGEQIRHLIDSRLMGQEWLERVQSADAWILMIRPKLAKQDDDIFSRPLGHVRRPNPTSPNELHRSMQARLVELLQMLLYARNLQQVRPLPALVVLLSCWDELGVEHGAKPDDELNKRLPLLSSFIGNRWGSLAAVFGLSALGTALSSDRANVEFIDKGPENFGYVVDRDGIENSDLTLPIIRVAEMVRE